MYQHTQSGSPTIWFLALSGVIPLGLLLSGAASDPLARVVLWAALVVLIACGWLFSSLTVTINGTKLAWRFGPGLIRKAVPIKNIERAARVRAPALAGWGIHWTPRGWLYNVSGVEAVHIQLRDGKQFLLGTDEADPTAPSSRARPVRTTDLTLRARKLQSRGFHGCSARRYDTLRKRRIAIPPRQT